MLDVGVEKFKIEKKAFLTEITSFAEGGFHYI